MIRLPAPEHRGPAFAEVLVRRRSLRAFTAAPLELGELAQLCFATLGITGQTGGLALRAAPSAGALYPLELYAIAHRVIGLEPAVYHYVPNSHALERRREGDFNAAVLAAGLGQRWVGEAAINFVLTAVPERTRSRYRDRTDRYIFMEAGHAAQNLLLQTTALGLGAVAVGAFLSSDVDRLLGVDGRAEYALYLTSVGKTKASR